MPGQKDKHEPAPQGSDAAARRNEKFSPGGNPAFDERRAPKGERPRKGRVYAGGNPWFDERDSMAPKPGSAAPSTEPGGAKAPSK